MPKENDTSELLELVKQARDLLDQALTLAKASALDGRSARTSNPKTSTANTKAKEPRVDFTIPMRAFVKKYGPGMSGAKKFALLVAYLSHGDQTKRVALSEIEKAWNSMTASNLLGMKFNRLYSVRARESNWVTTEKTGLYYLRPAWKEIFE